MIGLLSIATIHLSVALRDSVRNDLNTSCSTRPSSCPIRKAHFLVIVHYRIRSPVRTKGDGPAATDKLMFVTWRLDYSFEESSEDDKVLNVWGKTPLQAVSYIYY